jgi:Fe-S-cluster formation regulator IscX/YfhJ
MYDPKKNIRMVQKKIREWVSKLDDISDDEKYNQIFENIIHYIDESDFPVIDTRYYVETLEGWKLITYRNKLEKEYPREFKQVLLEEKKEIRETLKMTKLDGRNIYI